MVALLITLLACTQPADTPATPDLSPIQQITRISLDVRGVRPDDDELEAVEADPSAIGDLIDTMLQDERFGSQIRNMYAEIYRTRYENYYIIADEYGFHGLDATAEYDRSVDDEPLYILSEVALEDLPWTTIVSGDWTMTNEVLASIWPTDYPEGDTGWEVAHYTDGRPTAGVLSTNTMWIRYYSTESNANRGRANQLSRILLCADYLERPVNFDISASSATGDALQNALRDNESCVTCHAAIDPLAGFLYGFWNYGYPSAEDSARYHPDREILWDQVTGVPPAYFGKPGFSLSDLADNIASDPRFASCAVEQVYQGLLRRKVELADDEALLQHQTDFIDSGLEMRDLFRSVLTDPRYLADGTEPDTQVDAKLVTSDLMASEIYGLTGFDWRYNNYEMMSTDLTGGVRVMAGGVDGSSVTTVADLPNVTYALVLERLSELAATYAINNEVQQEPDQRRLFTEVDFTETPHIGKDAIVAQIVALRRRVLSQLVDADSPTVADDLALWETYFDADGDAPSAWRDLLVTFMRDPDFVVY